MDTKEVLQNLVKSQLVIHQFEKRRRIPVRDESGEYIVVVKGDQAVVTKNGRFSG